MGIAPVLCSRNWDWQASALAWDSTPATGEHNLPVGSLQARNTRWELLQYVSACVNGFGSSIELIKISEKHEPACCAKRLLPQAIAFILPFSLLRNAWLCI
jgi:hypothetical protein